METKSYKTITLSRLGMGNMRLPTEGDAPGAPIDYARASEMIDKLMKSGVNYYDTAYVYHSGESEKFLGDTMKKYPRDSYCLATKYFIQADPDYKKVFEEQLARLQTDHIDFYLIHGIFDTTYQQYIDSGCIESFAEQKRLGTIRYLGFSSHAKPEHLATFADYRDWDFAQIQLNYFDWFYGTAKAEYEELQKRNIPIMVMEPVRGGRLASLTPETEARLKAAHSDWSIASWALRWVRTLPQVQVILSGMSTLSQVEDNLATFSDLSPLSDADKQLLEEVCEQFHTQVRVPCTACRYCCDGCPVKINIPEFLKVYNRYKVDGPRGIKEAIAAVQSEGTPADCIACGSCTGHCPQSIDVPTVMAEMAGLM